MGLYIPANSIGNAGANGAAAGIMVGDFASSYATGSGVTFSSTYSGIVKCYGESTSDLTSAVNARVGVFHHLVALAGTINHETYGAIGQICVKAGTTLAHLHAGLMGTFETNGDAPVVNGAYTFSTAGVMSRLGVGTSLVTATKTLCGFAAVYNGGALKSGTCAAFAAGSTTATTWTYFLAAEKCDYFFYATSGTDYAAGVKIASISNVATTASGVLKVKVVDTTYYIPLWAASQLDGE